MAMLATNEEQYETEEENAVLTEEDVSSITEKLQIQNEQLSSLDLKLQSGVLKESLDVDTCFESMFLCMQNSQCVTGQALKDFGQGVSQSIVACEHFQKLLDGKFVLEYGERLKAANTINKTYCDLLNKQVTTLVLMKADSEGITDEIDLYLEEINENGGLPTIDSVRDCFGTIIKWHGSVENISDLVKKWGELSHLTNEESIKWVEIQAKTKTDYEEKKKSFFDSMLDVFRSIKKAASAAIKTIVTGIKNMNAKTVFGAMYATVAATMSIPGAVIIAGGKAAYEAYKKHKMAQEGVKYAQKSQIHIDKICDTLKLIANDASLIEKAMNKLNREYIEIGTKTKQIDKSLEKIKNIEGRNNDRRLKKINENIGKIGDLLKQFSQQCQTCLDKTDDAIDNIAKLQAKYVKKLLK